MKIGLNAKQNEKSVEKPVEKSAKIPKMWIFEKKKAELDNKTSVPVQEDRVVDFFDDGSYANSPSNLSQQEDSINDVVAKDNSKALEYADDYANSDSSVEMVATDPEQENLEKIPTVTVEDNLDFVIDADVLFSESEIFSTEEEDIPLELVNDTVLGMEELADTTCIEEDDEVSSDIIVDKGLEPLQKPQVTPYKQVSNVEDNYITDREFEALLEIFSSLTKEEVEALPENYKKIFYQNFKENEAYLDEETDAAIRKKLNVKIATEHATVKPEKESELQQVLNCPITVGEISLPLDLFNKTTNTKQETLIEPKLYEQIKNKLNNHVTLEELTPTCEMQNVPQEATVVVYYANDDVPEALLLEKGLIGLKAYEVYVHNTLQKCNRNYEIPIQAGAHVIINTGVYYVADANCNVSVLGGRDTTDFILERSYENEGNLHLEYVALCDTFIGKSSIVGSLKF